MAFSKSVLPVAAAENIVMDAPSGSDLVNEFIEDDTQTYKYKVYNSVVVGEKGTLIQQITTNFKDPGSPKLLKKILPSDVVSCSTGEWGRYAETKKSSTDIVFERQCFGESTNDLYGYQGSRLLMGSQKTFLVTFIWMLPRNASKEERSEFIDILSDETRRYLESVQICDSPGHDSCQSSIDDYMTQRAKEYIDNKI